MPEQSRLTMPGMFMSQSCTAPFWFVVARILPVGLKVAAMNPLLVVRVVMAEGWVMLEMFHKLMPCGLAKVRILPSGLNAAWDTVPAADSVLSWAAGDWLISQRVTGWPVSAVAMVRPSGLRASRLAVR